MPNPVTKGGLYQGPSLHPNSGYNMIRNLKRPDPQYRPGGTTNFYEGMVPYYNEKFTQNQQPAPQAMPQPESAQPMPQQAAAEPEQEDFLGKVKRGIDTFNNSIGLTDRTVRNIGKAASMAGAANTALNLSDRLKPSKGKAKASYPKHAAWPHGLLDAGIGSGYAIGTSSADTPASP